MACFARYSVATLLFYFGIFRTPWLCAKGHASVISKIASARELGYDWGRSLREHPRAPDQRSASTNHNIYFRKTLCVLILVISLGYYVMRTTYKYRPGRPNWNKTFHVRFLKMVCYPQVGLKHLMFYSNSDNTASTHRHSDVKSCKHIASW